MKTIFMGTSAFAVPILQALLHSEHDITAVYTAEPKAAGRGLRLQQSPIHILAEQHGIKVYTPRSLKGDEASLPLREVDIVVVAAYGLILPPSVLEAPRLGCINVHPSSLPRWRGAAPIQRTIMARDMTTSVCIIKMDQGCDTGSIIVRKDCNVEPNVTADVLSLQLAQTGADLLLLAMTQISDNTASYSIQEERGATYAHKITKDDAIIKWSNPAWTIDCQIRALYPKPAAFFRYQNIEYKVIKAHNQDICNWETADLPEALPPGLLLYANKEYAVVCGDGNLLILDQLQKPGSRVLTAKEFFNGSSISPGHIVS